MAAPEARRNAYVYCALQDMRQARHDRHARDNGLSMQAFLVVNALYYAKEGMAQSEICRRTFNSRQTVSLVVKRLVADGYAATEPDPADKRSCIVSMTSEGRVWAHDMVRRITRAEDEAMGMLAPEEQAQLVSLARRFTENLMVLIDDERLELADVASGAKAFASNEVSDEGEMPALDGSPAKGKATSLEKASAQESMRNQHRETNLGRNA